LKAKVPLPGEPALSEAKGVRGGYILFCRMRSVGLRIKLMKLKKLKGLKPKAPLGGFGGVS